MIGDPARGREERLANREKALRDRIDDLLAGGQPRKLEDERRLNAALLVRDYLADAKRRTKAEDVRRVLKSADPESKGAFRIDRWTLDDGVTVIGLAEVERYRSEAFPLKKTATYLRLIGALAELRDMTAFDGQAELLARIGLDAAPDSHLRRSDEDNDPARRLAALLQHFAAVMAEKHDLTSLWRRAERAQASWDPQVGPVACETELNAGAFRADASPCPKNTYWYRGEAPPCPAIRIAGIPFGFVRSRFELSKQGGEASPEYVEGEAIVWWDVHLMIGPDGPFRAGAYLMRDCRTELTLDDGSVVAAPIANCDDGLPALAWVGDPPRVKRNREEWSVLLSPEWRAPRREDAPDPFDALYRPSKAPPGAHYEPEDEQPPHHYTSLIWIEPVSAGSIRRWLIEDRAFRVADERRIEPREAEGAGYTELPLWNRPGTLAWAVEAGLHTGVLERSFAEWIAAFDASLTETGERRRAEAERAEAELRERWRNLLEPPSEQMLDKKER